MTKMDKYFEKRLTDYKASEDNWNLPSEEIWEKALPHFPKKKPIYSWFSWLGLGGFLLMLSSYFLSYQASSPDTDASSNLANAVSYLSEPIPSEKTETTNALKELSLAKEVQDNNSTIKKSEVHHKSETSLSPQTNPAIQPIAIKETTLEQVFSDPVPSPSPAKVNKQILLPPSPSSEQLSATKPVVLPIKYLPVLRPGKIISTIKPHTVPGLNAIPIEPLAFVAPRKEIGIGSAKYIINLLTLAANLIEDENDSINFYGKIRSANFYYRKWLSPKWSMSTGAYYTQGVFDFDVIVTDTLSCGDLSVFVNNQLGNQLTGREACANDTPNHDFELYLQDGITVEESDSLEFHIKTDLEVKALQFPLTFTRHWYGKRMEYTLGLGVTLDYYRLNQGFAELDIHREGVSILKEIYTAEPHKGHNLDYSVILDTGFRVKLSSKMNLGFTSRINLRNILLTGMEMGIFYRW